MSWTMNAAEDEFVGIDKSPGSDNPAIKEYEAIFEALFMGTPLPFIADKNGAPLQFFEKEHLLDDLADRAFTLGSKDKDIKMNLSFFLDMSEGSPKLMLLSIPALMSMCQDTELTIGNPTKYQEKSSVTGAGTLDANVSFELISIDRSAQLANLIFSSRLDVESQKDILRERSKSSDTPFTETEIENFLVRGEEQAECLVDMKTGWVKSMTHSYVVNAKNKTNRMTHSIEVNWR